MGETETKTAAGASGTEKGKNHSVLSFFGIVSDHCRRSAVEGRGEGKGQRDNGIPLLRREIALWKLIVTAESKNTVKGRVIERSLLSPVISHCFGPAQKGEREREKGMSRSSTTLGVDFPKGANRM